MNKGTAIIAVLVAFVGGYFLGSYTTKGRKGDVGTAAGMAASKPIAEQEKDLGPGNPQSDRARVLVAPYDAVKGSAEAPVTVIEFSDFQCPYCKRGADTVNQIAKEYPKDVRIVFKHNPLSFHKDAFLAAEAAMAAGEQGKFWEYHDKLFGNQQKLDRASLEQYAQELQLDMGKFRQALDSHKFKQSIDESIKYAASVGARGTPTFFVNGKLVRGAQPFDQFKPTLDAELKYAKELMGSKGIASAAVYTEIMRQAKPGSPMAAGGPQQPQPGAPDPAKTYKVPVGSSPFKGPATAKLTVIEFSDFECPFCGRVEPTLTQLVEKYGKDIRIVWKHQPLPMHPRAPLASEASMAAHEQGKFWEYHDKLMANQKALERPQLEQYAQELGLDMAKFKAALDGGKFKQAVAEDMKVATQFGVRGTPAFFINGRPLRGAQPIEAFTKLCDEELAEANALVAKGISANQLYDEITKSGETEVKAAPPQQRGGQPDPNAVYKIPVDKTDPAIGPASAKVTIVEWSDFQCPFCSRVAPIVHEIQKKYPKDVRVVFKQLPLPMHPQAPLAAEASLAAQEQGKFWELHDLMFANQKMLDRPSIEGYAKQAGLDVNRFKAAIDGGKHKAKVQADTQAASQFAVRGTPTFFINGKFLAGGATIEVLEQRVKEEIAKADALPKGTRDYYAALTKAGLDKVAGPPAGGAAVDTTIYNLDPGNGPMKGSGKAAVTIIEFSDFECPFCGRVIPTLNEIAKAYPNDVKIYFKQLPLPMHPRAPLAAEASLAAHEQGKFWEYHDKLFANQKALDRPQLEQYAQELGLNVDKFKASLDSGKFKAQVEADKQAASSVGIGGTPTFLINGRKLSGALPFDQFKALIDEELAKAKGKKPAAPTAKVPAVPKVPAAPAPAVRPKPAPAPAPAPQ